MAEITENERVPFIIINIDKDFALKSIGFIFIFLGILLCIINKPFCDNLCDTCDNQELMPCFLLLIFAGITFIINGAVLIILRLAKEGKDRWFMGKL